MAAIKQTDPTEVTLSPWLYKGVWIAIAAVAAILIASFWFGGFGGITIAGFFFPNAAAFLILIVTVCIASIRSVHSDEWGGVEVFNIPARQLGPSVVLVIPGIMKLHTAPRTPQEVQFPGDPEEVFKGSDDEPLPDGMVRPMRIMSGPARADDPSALNVQMAVSASFSIRWVTTKDNFWDFFINIPGKTWEDKRFNVERQMRDTGEGMLAIEWHSKPVSGIIADLEVNRVELQNSLNDAVKDWGIRVVETRLQSPDISHGVAHALASIPAARAQAEATVTSAKAQAEATGLSATAESNRIRLEGEAKADAKHAKLRAEGEGYADAAKALKMTGSKYYAGQIARDTIGEGDVIIGTKGVEDVLGIGKTILETAQKRSAS